MVTSFAEWELDETGYLQCDYPLRTSRCLQMENIGDYSDMFEVSVGIGVSLCFMLYATFNPVRVLPYAATGDDGYQVKCGPPRCRILSLASQLEQLNQRFTLKFKTQVYMCNLLTTSNSSPRQWQQVDADIA